MKQITTILALLVSFMMSAQTGSTNYGTNTGFSSGEDYNSAFGFNSLTNNTGDQNTATGAYSLQANLGGNQNSAFGFESLKNNTSGNYNTAIGYEALNSNDVASDNTAVGYMALRNNTGSSAKNNSAFGVKSLYSNTSGPQNTALGWGTLYSNTTGEDNTATGYKSLYSNTDGKYNSAYGYSSLYSNITGQRNSAFGHGALFASTGNYNTAVGYSALTNITSGSNNTALGYRATSLSLSPTNQTVIGYYAEGQEDNSVVLGNDNVTAVYMAEDAGATVYAAAMGTYDGTTKTNVLTLSDDDATLASDLTVNGNIAVSSDIRLKKNIINLPSSIDNIKSLRPVSYSKKNTLSSKEYSSTEIGLIAQELQEIYPNMVSEDDSEDPLLSVSYMELIPVLIKGMQEQQTMIEKQQAEIDGLKKIIGSTLPRK